MAKALSGGMKQKLALSCALIHRPRVLLLDEPTTGVDAVSRSEFWKMLGRLKDMGITVLVSTSYMDEAERCEYVALMNKGKILDVNTPKKLMEGLGWNLYNASARNVSASRRLCAVCPTWRIATLLEPRCMSWQQRLFVQKWRSTGFGKKA